jgi:serine protease inhibitor ecotin
MGDRFLPRTKIMIEETKKAEILLQELKITFSQENDCTESSDAGQFLEIHTENGGGGDFFIINTKRWSFDNIDELVTTLNQFKEKHDKIKLT